MKLHKTMIEELLKTYEVNSGWTEEHKLRTALERLDFSVYVQTDGTLSTTAGTPSVIAGIALTDTKILIRK